MEQHRLDDALEAAEALEALFDAALPDYDPGSRRRALVALSSLLTSDRIRIRARPVGAEDWVHEWATRSRRILVGRDHVCDIRIPGTNVSGTHFELERFGSKLAIRDLDSTMGTTLNDERLEPFSSRRLRPGDLIVASRSLEFTVLPPPRERGSYDALPAIALSDDQKLLVGAIIELRNAGEAVGPLALSQKLKGRPGFSKRSIDRHVRKLREDLGIPFTEQREQGYASIVRITRALGLDR